MRNHQQKNIAPAASFEKKGGFVLDVAFTDNTHRTIDFKPVFNQLQGDYAKWNKPRNFNRVKIENGYLIWGKNADVIFNLESIYTGKIENEILP
jgi:hypothetical protein